jgi:hypothetical protein
MNDSDKPKVETDKGAGLGTIAAIAGALITASLVAANTSSININFIVYKAHNIPLWWYTLIIVGLTTVTDRVLRFVWRRRKARKIKK